MIEVTLKTAVDELTGLAINHYEWFMDDTIKMRVEIANRWIVGTVNPCRVMAYDPEIDGAQAERMRKLLQDSLNGGAK